MLSLIYFISAKVRIKSCRCAKECFICTCIWLHGWTNSYRLVHYSYTWLFLTGLSWLLDPYFLSQIQILYILYKYGLGVSTACFPYNQADSWQQLNYYTLLVMHSPLSGHNQTRETSNLKKGNRDQRWKSYANKLGIE